jgi:type II secretory pathway pseudopilin PulG
MREVGLGLVETLVAMAILGTCAVAFAAGLSAGSMASNEQRREVVAQELAQNELEFVKSTVFVPGAGTYPTVSTPPGYSINVAVSAVPGADANIQKITVTVIEGGQSLLTLADYKVNR